jgi:BirA family biotin operon repressor/biotin-[acetyl-CoA-carboxylase] ligase
MDGRKLAGILMEAVSTPGGESRIVIGIGVNVAHAPEGLPYPATSLAAYGARVRAEELFETLSDCWVYHERIWEEGRGFSEVRHRWLKRAAGVGLPIAVRMGEDLFRGVFETIDSDGRLVLRTPDGFPKTITAGDVHFGLAATAGI